MIDDGVKEHGRDDVVVQDISMHLLDAIEAAETPAADVEAQPPSAVRSP